MLNWVEIWRVRRPHHSLYSLASQEVIDYSPPVWAGVIVHEYETITNGSGMWCNMWVQNVGNISIGIQISDYLNKLCLIGKTNATPNHNTTASKRCYRLYTEFRMLFAPPAPDTSSINMPKTGAHFICEQNIHPLLPSPSWIRPHAIAIELLGAVSSRLTF